jgi:hypothetical protein
VEAPSPCRIIRVLREVKQRRAYGRLSRTIKHLKEKADLVLSQLGGKKKKSAREITLQNTGFTDFYHKGGTQFSMGHAGENRDEPWRDASLKRTDGRNHVAEEKILVVRISARRKKYGAVKIWMRSRGISPY